MKLIPRYQKGTPKKGVLYESYLSYIPLLTTTFVPNGIYSITGQPYEVWKREIDLEAARRAYDKNELIGPALNIPEDLKEYYRRRGETLLWMDQRARNFESFGNLLNLTMPSTYAGQIIGRKLTGPEALAVDLVTAPILGGIKTVGKKGVQTAAKLATKGAEAYRRRFVYPREGLPQWFYTQKPLIARGNRPYTSPQSSRWRLLLLSEPIMDGGKNIAWPARKGFNPILEEDIPELQKMYNEGKFREMTVHHPRKPSETVKMYFLPNKKQPISEQELEALLEKYNPPLTDEEFNNPFLTVDAKTELGKAKKTYKKIKDKYSGEMEELKNLTEHDYTAPIDWNWYNGGILSESNVPAKVAISPVFDPRYGRIVNPKSIILRFYDNILNKDGIIQRTLKYLLDKKIIEPWEGKWVYQIPGRDSRVLVDPTRFTLNWILEKELQSTNRVPFSRMLDLIGRTEIPYHSTPIGDRTLYQLFADPSKRPLFTSIDDGSKGFYPLKRAYQKTQYGTSIPVFTKSKLIEGDPLISENGLHSSNNFGDVGELMSHFLRNRGKPQKVIDVSDARNIKGNTGLRQNEYNFGAGTPDIGFLLNTLDLSEPARVVGPFQGYKKGGKFNKY